MKRMLTFFLSLLAALSLAMPASADAIAGPELALHGMLYYWPVTLVAILLAGTILLLWIFRKRK